MNKVYIMLAAVSGLAFVAPAFADDTVTAESKSKTTVKADSSGNYEQKRTTSAENTDSAGTTTSTETELKEKADINGNDEKSVTTKTVVDPKGLMNKEKTVTTDVVKHKGDRVEIKHKKKVNGKTVENEEHTENTAN